MSTCILKTTILLTCCKGRHCCLWCTIRNTELKVPLSERGRSPLRSLQSMEQDHQKFLNAGGVLKKANEYNNVIGTALLPIPLEKVHVCHYSTTDIFYQPHFIRTAFQDFTCPSEYLTDFSPYWRASVSGLMWQWPQLRAEEGLEVNRFSATLLQSNT